MIPYLPERSTIKERWIFVWKSPLLNRLWPLLVVTVVPAGLALVWPQVAAIAAGFCVIWSLSWRHQESAVTAIEERDGVTFYVATTDAIGPVKLVRTPGLRRDVLQGANV